MSIVKLSPLSEFAEPNLECLICKQDLDPSQGIGHCPSGFHKSCIFKWIKTNSDCPCCRTPIDLPFHLKISRTISQTGSLLKYSATRGVLCGLSGEIVKGIANQNLHIDLPIPIRGFAMNGIFSALKFMGGRFAGKLIAKIPSDVMQAALKTTMFALTTLNLLYSIENFHELTPKALYFILSCPLMFKINQAESLQSMLESSYAVATTELASHITNMGFLFYAWAEIVNYLEAQ